MNYNEFTYYRANPYAKQGYMPPIAFANRHKPEFLTQLPMGEEHLSKIGRRQYSLGVQRSNIEAENLLKSPERYPFENRIALDKSFERNMNTIDIEGASSGTLVSPAIRNKMKAREELIRRREQQGQTNFERLERLKANQQQKRRKLAYEQYIRIQKMQQLNSGRLRDAQADPDSQAHNSSAEQIKETKNYHLREIKKSSIAHQQPQQEQASEPNMERKSLIKPRHQSIDVGRSSSFNPELDTDLIKPMYGAKQMAPDLGSSQAMLGRQESYRSPDRKQMRQQNPTVLSSENSIYLAGRNSLLL